MIFLDQPYVSDFLKATIRENNLPAFDSGAVTQAGELNLLTDKQVIEKFRNDPELRACTISENAIAWIYKNLGFTDLPEKIKIFKDKLAFRELIAGMYPDFFFKEVSFSELSAINPHELPMPFIIKPATGFFSMGVYRVSRIDEWEKVREQLIVDVKNSCGMYPLEVLDTQRFIIEELIEGTEYAFDSYIDNKGEPVILGMMQHVFSSEKDVSDRLYITSKRIVQENLARFNSFIREVAEKANIRNFLLHSEVRIDTNGRLVPIELNPMRFGAWCTSAELTHYAFNTNSYLNYLTNTRPDWKKILAEADDSFFGLVILNNSTSYDEKVISGFNFMKLVAKFEKIIELRKIDYHKYPIFGMLYVKTDANNFAELEAILHADLKEFVEVIV